MVSQNLQQLISGISNRSLTSLVSCACDLVAIVAQYVVCDGVLVLLHVLLELELRVAERHPSAALSVLLLPMHALQTSAMRAVCGSSLSVAPDAARILPLLLDGKPSRLHVRFCSNWAEAAGTREAQHVRALYIPAVDTYLGCVGTNSQLHEAIIPKLLGCFPAAALFPPREWEDVFEHKQRTYELFGPQFMLPSLWLNTPSLESLDAAAAAMLRDRTDGLWMVKGSWSWGAHTAHVITVKEGACAQLRDVLHSLFTKYHQRCVGIQPYEPSLRNFELRTYLVADAGCPGGWRQSVSVCTRICSEGQDDFSFKRDTQAEMVLPLHGPPLLIAGFLDRLLATHARTFRKAAALGIPVLRIDCGYSEGLKRCFLNELGCMDQISYSAVTSQDVACVHGRGYSVGISQLLFR